MNNQETPSFCEIHISKSCLSHGKMKHIYELVYSIAKHRILGILCPEQSTQKWPINEVILNVLKSDLIIS